MKFQYYRSTKNKKWYWRLVAKNGRTVADGSQGYKSKHAVERAIARVKDGIRGQTFIDIDEVDA